MLMAIQTGSRRIISASVEPTVAAQLERLAREHDRSLSAEVRRAVREHLARVNETKETQ
jgi:hypothetical protein